MDCIKSRLRTEVPTSDRDTPPQTFPSILSDQCLISITINDNGIGYWLLVIALMGNWGL